jgi:hypothetical protein
MKWIIGVLFASVCVTTCSGQYQILKGKTDPGDMEDCFPKTPARICLGAAGTTHCYAPPSDKDYIFGLEPKAMPVGQLDGHELTLFTAMFSGCGSGTLTHYSLLTVRNGEFINLLPKVELTNVSEFKLWNLTQFSSLPVLITADFIWNMDAGESHFDRHRYKISVYVYDPKSHFYTERIHFNTEKNYSGGDSNPINALELERPTILAKLQQEGLN